MYKKLLDLYPGLLPVSVATFEGFRIRYFFDSVNKFKLHDEGEDPDVSVKKLKSFIGKIFKEFLRGEKLNCTLIVPLDEIKRIDGRFFSKKFPEEIKSLFSVKDGDVIHYDEFYYMVFDIEKLKPDVTFELIKLILKADYDLMNLKGRNKSPIFGSKILQLKYLKIPLNG